MSSRVSLASLLTALAVVALAAAPRQAPAQALNSGDLIVVDDQTDALYRVDPVTGDRTILSQAGVRGAGVPFGDPLGIERLPAGNLHGADYSVDPRRGNLINGGVLGVDPLTGDRFNKKGTQFNFSFGTRF